MKHRTSFWVVIITIFSVSLAGGETTVRYTIDNPADISVSWDCVASSDNICRSCDSPKIQADIVHFDPLTCVALCKEVKGGFVIFKDGGNHRQAEFTLREPECSFTSSHYSWDYNPANYVYGSGAGRLLLQCEARNRCRESRGERVTFQRMLGLFLEHIDNSLEYAGFPSNNNLTINLNCPKCAPLDMSLWDLPPAIERTYFESPQSYAQGGYPPLKYSLAGGSLPPGMSLDFNTGKVSGTSFVPGHYSFKIKANDSCPYGSQEVVKEQGLQVDCIPFEVYSDRKLPDGKGGVAYPPHQLKHGGQFPFTYAIVSGSLPEGLALNTESGTISGTPPKKDISSMEILSRPPDAGTSTFTVEISDSCALGKRHVQKEFSLYVAQDIIGPATPLTADIALTDMSLDKSCRVHVKYANKGKIRIKQGLRQQAWVDGMLAYDMIDMFDLAPGASLDRVLPKPVVSKTVTIKVVVDGDNLLRDGNKANNILSKTLTCRGE